MIKKLSAIILSFLMAISFILNSPSKNVHASTNEPKITTRSNDAGGGVGGGNFEYYSNGVIKYTHDPHVTVKTTSKYTIYLPSSFIDKINSTGSNPLLAFGAGALGSYIAKSIGSYASHPVVKFIVAAISFDWTAVCYADNGNGVTLVYGTGIRPDRIISGRNHYATLTS